MTRRLAVISRDLWRHRDGLATILDADLRPVGPGLPGGPGLPRGCDAVLGWAGGRGRAARLLARALGVPFRAVSVGPLGFIRPGGTGHPFSLVVAGSRKPEFGQEAARSGLETLRTLRLAWRNDGRDVPPPGTDGRSLVLRVVDRSTGAAPTSPPADTALAVIADCREPSIIALTAAAVWPGAIPVSGTNPWALFDVATRVEGPDGDLLRLARIAGLEVSGPLAGADPTRLFARTFLEEPVYLDAWSGVVTSFATAADQVAWLRDRFGENAVRTVCIGVSRWKAASVSRFLDGPDGPPLRAGTADEALRSAAAVGGRIVAWETRMPRRLEGRCAAANVPLARMEDGFLRSVGLGAAFLPGASCVLDERGIYYDPGRPSDLEHILTTAEFGPDLLERAARLRESVVALRLSKYNVGASQALDRLPRDRPIVLVPGQVEDDASVLLGSPGTPGNRALLAAARRRNPDAFLIFKPHPDVEAGLRKGQIPAAEVLRFADRVVADASITDLFDVIDRVETMTSLAGFEALLRGKPVAVHGRPFYAGWGLTDDRDPPPGRSRRLLLDELVAGALILYPRYVDPETGRRCPPEVLVRRLSAARDTARREPSAARRARAAYVRARHALLGPAAAMLRRRRGATRDGTPPDEPR